MTNCWLSTRRSEAGWHLCNMILFLMLLLILVSLIPVQFAQLTCEICVARVMYTFGSECLVLR